MPILPGAPSVPTSIKQEVKPAPLVTRSTAREEQWDPDAWRAYYAEVCTDTAPTALPYSKWKAYVMFKKNAQWGLPDMEWTYQAYDDFIFKNRKLNKAQNGFADVP